MMFPFFKIHNIWIKVTEKISGDINGFLKGDHNWRNQNSIARKCRNTKIITFKLHSL